MLGSATNAATIITESLQFSHHGGRESKLEMRESRVTKYILGGYLSLLGESSEKESVCTHRVCWSNDSEQVADARGKTPLRSAHQSLACCGGLGSGGSRRYQRGTGMAGAPDQLPSV